MKKNNMARPVVKSGVHKIFRIMKLIVFLTLICVVHVFAEKGFSQTTSLTLELRNTSIENVLLNIEEQSSYYFLYNKDLVDVKRKVNAQFKNANIEEVLGSIFNGTGVKFRIMNNQIALSPDYREQSQAIKISGKVTDSSGVPLPGVSVAIKGTTVGIITDANGNYTLSDISSGATLVFSFVGMKTQEIAVGNQTVINVVMQEEAIGIQEVVAVGYGVTRKRDLTGSVSTVSAADFEKQPMIRMEEALRGHAAGVQVTKPNGAPGAGIKIRIRGANSINGSNEPLYVIDGYIGADILSLNPSDIESMSILKDASATSIYGSRGSNGVVLITTKRAQKGDSKIQFDAFYGVDQIRKTYDLMSGVEYMEIANIRNRTNGLQDQFTQAQIDEVRENGGTDWQDELFRLGATQNYQLSFSGGTEKTQYYLSGSLASQDGIIINSNYKRYGLRTNINSQLRKNFNLAFTMYTSYEESRNNYTQTGRNNPAGTALIYPPNLPVIDPATGDYTISPAYGPIAVNPIFGALKTIYDSKTLRSLGNITFNYTITDGLVLSVSGAAKAQYYDNPYLKTAAPGSDLSLTEAGHDNGYSWNLQNTNQLTYDKLFADKHKLNITAVYEQQVISSRSNGPWVTGFSTIALGYDNLSLGSTARGYSGYSGEAIQSYVGRLNYTYNDKYLFTASFRADGSSKFYGDNKYGYFPSAALAWRASEESFIRDLNVFQNLKVRASYGLIGSQAIGAYKTLPLLSLGQDYSYDGSTNRDIGIAPGVAANPNLKWETTAQFNGGLDFGIFDGRLSGTLDYYYKKTTDLLMDVKVPMYSGGGTITQNVGSMQNQGFEFLISAVILDKTDWKINSSLNFSLNRNKVLELGDTDELFVNSPAGNSSFYLKEGEPLGQFRGYVSQGLWQENEITEAAKFGKKPGDSKYLDIPYKDGSVDYVNGVGDYNISGEDMMLIGCAQPDFIWGWNTNIQYKNFDLTLYVNGIQGADVWDQTRCLTITSGGDVKNPVGKEVLNYWTPQNPNTEIAGFNTTNVTYAQSSQFVENGSFVRLSNVTLGYTFPKSILRNALQDVRVYVSGQNLLLLTGYKGIDPELSSTDGSDITMGVDNGTYPATRTVTFGVRIGF
ncbi:MAG: TonB-dependent receptor [Mangrovibacterium sp.]